MKIKINKSKFENILNTVSSATASKETIPILKGIFINHNTILATDLELGIKVTYECDEVIEKGQAVFPKKIVNIISSLPNELITIEVDENYQAKIECGNSEFNLKCFDPAEYPQFPTVEKPEILSIDSKELGQALNKVRIACSDNDTQPALTGVHFEKGYLTATNKYMLGNQKINQLQISDDVELNIPRKTVDEVVKKAKLCDDIKMEIGDNYVKFNFDDTVIISRLIEGEFPNWRQVMSDDYVTKIEVDKNLLKNVVKRSSIIAQEGDNVVKIFTEDDELKVVAKNEGEINEEVINDFEIEGDDIKISLDISYLSYVLKVLNEDTVNIKWLKKISPLTIEEDGFTFLIMPMREDK
jgi:DNA polymerase-3 subunit beta